MPATLYIRPQPRAFFLVTTTHALIFRQPDAKESKASRTVVVAEFLPIDEVDVRGLVRASKTRTVEGVLGVTSVPTERSPVPEIFLVLVSAASPLAPLLPGSSLRPSRILSVEFHSLSSSFWDPPEFAIAANPLNDYDPDDAHFSSGYSAQSSTQSQAALQGVENPCNGMRKYIESGGFFFAEGGKWDVSSRMGETNWIQAERRQAHHPLETYDERFVWNSTLLAPFLAFRSGLPEETRRSLDEQSLLIPVIQGFCGSSPVTTGSWTPGGKADVASLAIISRLSWKRAGARFRTRGIDDDGQVANFVETEVILALGGVCVSYVQVRGSVPLFWQQPSQGIQTLQQRVELTRPPQATQPAFDKHFLDLLEHYHSIHAVNLLGQRDAESMLSAAYSDHLAELKTTLDRTPPVEKQGMDASTSRQTLNLTPYDFHAVVREHGHDAVKYDFSTGLPEVVRSLADFGWTTIDITSGQVIEQQEGAFRVNCLDCLDRTNYVQDVISSIVLSKFLYSIDSILASSPTFWTAHRTLWADNGDRLSKIYAGTGALNTSATRTGKKTFAGLLSDATKSVGRAYINNFQDKGKQNAIDMLLGMMSGQRPVVLFDPISDSVQSALHSRLNEYSKARTLTLFSGTWNLNGKAPDESLESWLFPPGAEDADIYAIAFQEIVVLNAQQILQTDPAKRRRWEAFIMEHFAKRRSEYLLLRSEQLVGAALIIVVKQDLTKSMRSIEAATKKTGLSGLSGNKGGVGIRMNLFDTSVCFMTAHLAAGHSNVAERNADYRTISQGLKFLKGKMIHDHDIVIFEGDFNYRISLSNEEVRDYAVSDQLDPLIGADQLVTSMDQGEAFEGYDEGPITFRPTYKYDNGTDEYDSSEKQRIPAWTDRVLFKGSALRLKAYHRAELRTSDHRPVYAVFEATVREIDESRKEQITKEIVRDIRKTGSLGDTMDEKVERGLHNGLGGLVKEMTHASITPSLTPRPGTPTSQTQPPPIPARAAPSTLKSDEQAINRSRSGSDRSTGPPPLPRRGSPAPARLSTSPNSTDPHSNLPLAAKRAPPPRPTRPDTAQKSFESSQQPFKPSSSTVDEIQRRRTLTSPFNSEEGSKKMPYPPIPRPKVSVDLDGPPPEGLVTPVQPSIKTSPPSLPTRKPTLPTAPKAEEKTPPVAATRRSAPAIEVGKEPPKSSENAMKPSVSPSLRTNGAKTGSVADRLKQWEQLGSQSSNARMAVPRSPINPASSIPPSPTLSSRVSDKHLAPSIPKKPDTLRRPSANGSATSPP